MLRKLLFVLFGLIALLIIAIVLALVLFKPKDYVASLQRIVYKQTGKTLEITGPIKASVFPHLAIDVQDLKLLNPVTAATPQFLSVKRAKISLSLLSLLSAKIKVNKLVVNGAQFNYLLPASPSEPLSMLPIQEQEAISKRYHAVAEKEASVALGHFTKQLATYAQHMRFGALVIRASQLNLTSESTGITHKVNVNISIKNSKVGCIFNVKALFDKAQKIAVSGDANMHYEANQNRLALSLTQLKAQINQGRFTIPTAQITVSKSLGLKLDAVHKLGGKLRLKLNVKPELMLASALFLSVTNWPIHNIQALFSPHAKQNVKGSLNLTAHFLAQGETQAAILSTLSGKGVYQISKGYISGVNLNHYFHLAKLAAVQGIQAAHAHLRKPKNNTTNFTHIDGKFTVLKQNINTTFSLKNNDFLSQGSAVLYWPTQQLNAKVVFPLSSENHIPLFITGSLDKLSYRLGLKSIVHQVVKRTITQQIKHPAIKAVLNGLFSG